MPKRATRVESDAQRLLGSATNIEVSNVDALYGLEPVYEPGQDPRQRPLDATVEIECPHCWQVYETAVDLTLGAQSWVEDCQHCCHPISVVIEVIDDGRGARVTTERLGG